MIKRKPDPMVVLALLLALGVLASAVFIDSTPESEPQVATGFAAASNDGAVTASR